MYIKNKERVFKCIPSIVFGKFSKIHNYKETNKLWENSLTQCMNIINGGITKCMIMYDQIPGFSRSISFVRRHF